MTCNGNQGEGVIYNQKPYDTQKRISDKPGLR